LKTRHSQSSMMWLRLRQEAVKTVIPPLLLWHLCTAARNVNLLKQQQQQQQQTFRTSPIVTSPLNSDLLHNLFMHLDFQTLQLRWMFTLLIHFCHTLLYLWDEFAQFKPIVFCFRKGAHNTNCRVIQLPNVTSVGARGPQVSSLSLSRAEIRYFLRPCHFVSFVFIVESFLRVGSA
jgi:hypothetical protein